MTPTQHEQIGSTPEQRMLRVSVPPDFLESAHEWRRLFSEAWGPPQFSVESRAGCFAVIFGPLLLGRPWLWAERK